MPLLNLLRSLPLLVPMALAGAGITWETLAKQVTAKPGQPSVSVDFACTNAGTVPVSVSDLDTGCECTTARAEPASIAPGGQGRIHVDVDLARLVGTHDESVNVYLNGARTDPVELHLRVTVPETYRMTPTVLVWKVGGPPSEQTIRLEPTAGNTLRVIRVSAVVGAVATEVKAIANGRTYEIRIQPTHTREPATVPISIELSVDGLAPVTVQAYAVVSSD